VNHPEEMSPSGLATTEQEEGTILRVYKDISGIDTVCAGHVVKLEDRSWIADGVTIAECRSLLPKDIRWVVSTIHGLVEVDLAQHEFDALGDLIFNIGPTAFKSSTALRLLNQGDRPGAADAILLFCMAMVGGVKKPVLLARRRRERDTFLTGRYPVTIDSTDWLAQRDSVEDIFELTPAEQERFAGLLAVSMREEQWRDMDEARRLAHGDTLPALHGLAEPAPPDREPVS